MTTDFDAFNDALNAVQGSSASVEQYTFTAEEQKQFDKFLGVVGMEDDVKVVDKDGRTLLHRAAGMFVPIVKFLVSKGADVNARDNKGKTPLHTTATSDTAEIAEFLLSKGADVNARDYDGNTPLMAMAQILPKAEMAQFFISKGADVNAKNNKGETILHWAALLGKIDVIKCFVSVGADVNAGNDKRETPLHVAVMTCNHPINAQSRVEVIRFFISNGANVNAVDSDGGTPLHDAVSVGNIEIAKLLITSGADTNAKLGGFLSPLDLAKETGKTAMVRYLSNTSTTPSATNASSASTNVDASNAMINNFSFSTSASAASGYSGTSQSQWAGEDIGWAVGSGIVGIIALIISFAIPDGVGFFIGIIAVAGVLIGWGVTRSASKCPSCEQAWGKQTIKTTILDSRRDVRNTFETVYHRNSKGEVTGTTQVPTTKVVTVQTLQDEYRCKHCGHEWNKTYTTES